MGDFPSGQRGQTVNLLSLTSVVRIHHPPPTKQNICLPTNVLFLFIQAAVGVPRSELVELWGFPQAWHIIAARSVVYIISPYGAVSHHALACIYLRLDDIQHFVLVIYNATH